MKNSLNRIVALSLLGTVVAACGETVNYETTEKFVTTQAVGTIGAGNAEDAIEEAGSSAGTDSASPADSNSNDESDNATQPSESTAGLPGGREKSIAELCAAGGLRTEEHILSFPEIPAGTTCSFASADNLSRRNGFFRAYLRQSQIVSLPENAVLCGLSIQHESQDMRYDDEMFFLLNERILAATKDYSEYFQDEGMFEVFAWTPLRDKYYDPTDPRDVYCVGGAQGMSECQLPPTETRGTIELKFSDEMSITIAEMLRSEKTLTFDWITTGDNDDSDCRHSPISLGLTLQYKIAD